MKSLLMAFFLLLVASSEAWPHRGGQISSGPLKGCHADSTKGDFHCHSKSVLSGKSFRDRESALAIVGGADQNKESFSGKKPRAYDRRSWRHWVDEDEDCLNTRHETLKKRSLAPVKMDNKGCRVLSGRWRDFYYDEILTDSSDIDIDHVVPLKHASDNGGLNWSKAKKERFANDPENLVITNLKYNRQKGAKSPAQWLPLGRKYACRYLGRWMRVKRKYGLEILAGEQESLKTLECEN